MALNHPTLVVPEYIFSKLSQIQQNIFTSQVIFPTCNIAFVEVFLVHVDLSFLAGLVHGEGLEVGGEETAAALQQQLEMSGMKS